MRTPKQTVKTRREGWYRYYAGFSPDFVTDALQMVEAGKPLHILDPWVGAGTTAAVAADRGHATTGIDVNPALVVISKARLLRSDVADSLAPLTEDILREASRQEMGVEGDPMLSWFGPSATSLLRAIERAIFRILVDAKATSNPVEKGLEHLSDLAAFFYVALFRTTRTLIRNAATSNPTWVKAKIAPLERARPRRERIHETFREAQDSLADFLGIGQPATVPTHDHRQDMQLGSSTSLNLEDHSVDTVITSPPYCTRIDYVAGVRPELAILGCDGQTMKTLRHLSLGNPTVPREEASAARLPRGMKLLLKKVHAHPSKASTGYYYRYYETYFAMLARSLEEIHRVVMPGGSAFVVVQDSYYKNVHVDLPGLTTEAAEAAGWEQSDRFDFPVGRTMAIVNPKARVYRDDFRATESVLLLKRP